MADKIINDNESDDIILEVKNLKKHFPIKGNIFSSEKGAVKAVATHVIQTADST